MPIWSNIRKCLAFRRPSRRTSIALAIVLFVVVAGAILLRVLTWPLLAQGSAPQADFYCLHGAELGVNGFKAFDHAAAWHAEAAGRKILLLLPPDSRVVEIGAAPSFEAMCRRELDKRGISPSDVGAIRTAVGGVWGQAHALQGWLREHPGATVAFACSPLSSGRLRYVFDTVIGRADASRLGLTWLPEPADPPPGGAAAME